MPARDNWSSNWGQRTESALGALHTMRLQFNADINARTRMIKDAQRTGPNCSHQIAQLVRAPLAGLR